MVIGPTSNRSTQLPKAAYAAPAEPETRSKSGPPIQSTADIGGGTLQVPVQARGLSIGEHTQALKNTSHLAPLLTAGCPLATLEIGNGFRTGLSIHRSPQSPCAQWTQHVALAESVGFGPSAEAYCPLTARPFPVAHSVHIILSNVTGRPCGPMGRRVSCPSHGG